MTFGSIAAASAVLLLGLLIGRTSGANDRVRLMSELKRLRGAG